MRRVLRAGLAASATILPCAAAMGQQGAPPRTVMIDNSNVATGRDGWGQTVDGRWWAGDQAPGGWQAYRTPVPGFILPGYWMQGAFHVPDYAAFGLPEPPPGFGWSRYYDDAVLTDAYGKVYDSRIRHDWNLYPGYAQDRAPSVERRDATGRVIGGAVIGAVGGGLVGSAIAGSGNRTEGALIGAGVGAIAGGLIGDATAGDGDRDAAPLAGDDARYDRGRLRAERRLAREDARLSRDRAERLHRLDRLAQEAGYSDYDDYRRVRDERSAPWQPPAGGLHWADVAGEGPTRDGGYISGGYYYPPPLITTIRIDPDGTTTATNIYGTETVRPQR